MKNKAKMSLYLGIKAESPGINFHSDEQDNNKTAILQNKEDMNELAEGSAEDMNELAKELANNADEQEATKNINTIQDAEECNEQSTE